MASNSAPEQTTSAARPWQATQGKTIARGGPRSVPQPSLLSAGVRHNHPLSQAAWGRGCASCASRRHLVLLVLATVLLSPGNAYSQSGCEYTSYATADSVVPPVLSEASADMSAFDMRSGCYEDVLVDFRIGYLHLGSTPLGAHIHRGVAGQNGEVLLTVFDRPFKPDDTATVVLTSDVCEEMCGGLLYFIVETEGHPDGEVRGQVWKHCWTPTERLTWGQVRSHYR